MGFLVDRVHMGMDFPLILWFSYAIITPPVYLRHVSIYLPSVLFNLSY